MNEHTHTHVEMAQLAVIVRDLAEVVQIQSREINRLAILAEQQTDLRDRPQEFTVASATLVALHKEARRLAERLETSDEVR